MIASVRLAELLSARICHDLVNPVGACNNGLEMLADASSDIFDEAVELAQDSGRSAARVLQYFRLAYGTAADTVAQVRQTLAAMGQSAFSSEYPSFAKASQVHTAG